jgi:UDPglucose 6-dehydrogenase
MRVSIVGTGYVGLVSGVGLASIGHQVCCVDVDPRKVDMIASGKPPIFEVGLEELMGQVVGTSLTATTDLRAAVLDSDLTLIAVGTPFDGEHIDLTYIETAARQIGEALRDKADYHMVVVKSTVVPGTTDSTVLPILEEASGKKAGVDFGVGMNPEFLREGDAVSDFMHPDRIVVGGIDERSQQVLADLYAPFEAAEPPTEVMRTSPRTAEMIKYTANSLLATLISFSNEIANLAAAVGVDATEAMRGVHLDKRFTPILADGQRVWPGMVSYLEGGCGFGGSCFPKDVKALIAYGDDHGSPMQILRSVIDVNEAQPQRMLDLLGRHLPDVSGRRICVLGMAFKPGTDDIRESPSLPVTEQLLDAGAQVVAFDPIARHEAEKVFGDRVVWADDVASAVAGADAVLVMTRWPEFSALPDIVDGLDTEPIVIDGRRILDPRRFSRYEGIGR